MTSGVTSGSDHLFFTTRWQRITYYVLSWILGGFVVAGLISLYADEAWPFSAFWSVVIVSVVLTTFILLIRYGRYFLGK
jgi:hypothetical protein